MRPILSLAKNNQLEPLVAQWFAINRKISCNSGGPLLDVYVTGGVPPVEKSAIHSVISNGACFGRARLQPSQPARLKEARLEPRPTRLEQG
jgi:hypothetical protein